MRHAMSHPMEQMAAMGSLMLDGALERHPTTAGRVPRVGHRVAAVLARAPRRARGVDGGVRDPRTSRLRPSRVLRPPVRDLHRPRRPARGVGGRRGRRRPRDVGVGLPASRRAVPERGRRASCASPTSTASPSDDLATVLWDTPLRVYGWATSAVHSGPGVEPAEVGEHRGGGLGRAAPAASSGRTRAMTTFSRFGTRSSMPAVIAGVSTGSFVGADHQARHARRAIRRGPR